MHTITQPTTERIAILDIIRGFALFGILLVNCPSLNTPAWLDTKDFGFKTSFLDTQVTNFIFSFAMESFYPIFALLFGIGAAIFLSKDSLSINKLYARRMLFLLVIGFLHAFLVWWGDILIIYATLGIFLLLFNKLKSNYLIIICLSIILSSLIISTTQILLPTPQSTAYVGPDTLLIYSEGTFAQITQQRMHDWVQVFFLNAGILDLLVYFLDMFALMLLGMWVYKNKILDKLNNNINLLFLVITLSFLISILSYNIIYLEPISGISKGILYISILILSAKNKYMYKIISPLAYNGRMSMTNYLGFNIILSIIFYGYGCGLYGSIGPASQMPIVFSLYFGFLIMSNYWLKYYNYGPFEYIWRVATYGQVYKSSTSIQTIR
jgi:uncharacterized protein